MQFMRCTLSATKSNQQKIHRAARAVGLTIPIGQKPRFVAPGGRLRLLCQKLPDSVNANLQLWTEEAEGSIDEAIIRLVKRPRSSWNPKKIVSTLAAATATRLNINKATTRDFIENAICDLLASKILQWEKGRLKYVSN
ncbi:hypothetical protein BH09VER1_BH09VER1_47480 [soil metagenome]